MIVITPTEAGLQHRITDAISAAIETVRRRVDAMGTTEPQIVRQGSDRILVQVPGLQDTAQLKELIGKTARLTFHEVHPTISRRGGAQDARAHGLQDLSGRRPGGRRPAPARDAGRARRRARRARSRPSTSAPTSRSSPSASTTPARASSASSPRTHVGRPFAIVLDDKVISAPVIREPILGGSGQISGSFTVETANQLAIQLRSGALPAKLTVIEERVVGASLGPGFDRGRQARGASSAASRSPPS